MSDQREPAPQSGKAGECRFEDGACMTHSVSIFKTYTASQDICDVGLAALREERDGLAHHDRLIQADLQQFVTDCSTPTFQLVRNMRDALAQAEARVRERDQRIREVEAERGVILNGARLVASAALPFLKQENDSRPSHNTGEVLNAALHAIRSRTPETNESAVQWMREMKEKLTAQAQQLARVREALRFVLSSALIDRDGHDWQTCGELSCRKAREALTPTEPSEGRE